MKSDEKLTYWKAFDGIYEMSIDSKNEEKIFNSDEDTMLGFIATSKDNYYIYNMLNKNYKNGTDIYIGNIKDGSVVTKLYIEGENYLLPSYIGSNKLIIDIYGKDGKFCGYSNIKDGKLSDEIINTEIKR